MSGWLIRKAKTKMTDGNYTRAGWSGPLSALAFSSSSAFCRDVRRRGGWWLEATVDFMSRDGQDLTAREADY